MTDEQVVIIIPTYNEAQVIEETLVKVFLETNTIPNSNIHILVFDSQSTDGTQAIVRKLQSTYETLHLQTEPKKSGLGSAYYQAMQYAINQLNADIIFEFDADLSHQPKYIAAMLEKMTTYDVVIGSRYITGGKIPADWGWHRKLLSVLGNYVSRLVLTFKYKDFTSGFRATRRADLEKALTDQFISNNYAYKLQLLWTLHKNKARIHEYPIEFIDREKGSSKLPANSIRDSLEVIFKLRYKEVKPYLSMCLVGLTGMLIQCVIYNILRLKIPPFNAAQFAVVTAMINNFILNNQFTFKKQSVVSRIKKIKSFSLFITYSIAMILLQSSWLAWGVKHFGSGYLMENIFIITGIVIGSLLNYLTYSRLIWPKKKPNNPLFAGSEPN